MRKKFITGILISVAVLVLNQIFIQYWLNKKHQEASIINLAGRQRMLSQKISLEFFKLNQNLANRKIIVKYYKEWQTVHFTLLNNQKATNKLAVTNAPARNILLKLNPNVAFVGDALKTNQNFNLFDKSSIDKNQAYFLKNMDQVVNKLEIAANNSLNFIILTEIILCLLSVLIITLEVKYIYYPLANKNKAQKESLNAIAWQQSHEMRRPVANILGIINLLKANKNETDAEKTEQLEMLLKATEQLENVISKTIKITTPSNK